MEPPGPLLSVAHGEKSGGGRGLHGPKCEAINPTPGICAVLLLQVILATNVAESSVTIPGVAFVIDSCLSLTLQWERTSRRHVPRLQWSSLSQVRAPRYTPAGLCVVTL